MQAAIAQLEIALAVVVNNEPICRSEGRTEQADLQAQCAKEYVEAIQVLKAAESAKVNPV